MRAERATLPVWSADRGLDTTMLSCTAEPYACPGGSIVLLRVAGEIDPLTQPALHAALVAGLDGALDRTVRHLVIDLAGVTFCCVRGFALLADTAAAAAATGTGTGYAISGMPAHLQRYARLLWADQAPIPRYRSAAVAVTTIRREQAPDHPA